MRPLSDCAIHTYSHDLARPRRTLQETQASSRQVSKKIKKIKQIQKNERKALWTLAVTSQCRISRKTQHYSICRFGRFRQLKFETAAAFRGAGRSQDTGPSGSASGLGLNSHPASSAVRTARCVLRRIVCRVVKTHSRTVVAGTLQQQQQHHHD
jgi:hypothetical protein